MNTGIAIPEKFGTFEQENALLAFQHVRATENFSVLIACVDPEINQSLSEILCEYPVNAMWVKGVQEAQNVLLREKVDACLCSFWLEDGSYRDLVKQAKREASDVPVIIVSTPSCPDEYNEYLAAMNIGAFDFLCHPYQKRELERMLRLAITARMHSLR